MSWGRSRGLFHFFPYVGKEAQKERKGIQEKKEGQKEWLFFWFFFFLLFIHYTLYIIQKAI